MKQINYKKLIIPNIPYVFFVYAPPLTAPPVFAVR